MNMDGVFSEGKQISQTSSLGKGKSGERNGNEITHIKE